MPYSNVTNNVQAQTAFANAMAGAGLGEPAGGLNNADAVLWGVAELLQAAGEVFDVRREGAKGNGVTDDAPAIQRTITACAAAGGGLVRIPASSSAYKCLSALTLPSTVSLQGDGMEQSVLSFTAATNGIVWSDAVFNTRGGFIRDLRVLGSYGTSLVGIDQTNLADTRIQRVRIGGFTSGNLRVRDFDHIVLDQVYIQGGGDASNPNVLFDTVAAPGSSNGVFVRDSWISGGGVTNVALVRIERSQNVLFDGCTIESGGGPLVQISATNDGTDTKLCSNVGFYNIDFENPTGKYLEIGTAWAGVTYALKRFTLVNCYGTLSGSTTAAIGVAIKNTLGVFAACNNFVLGTTGTAHYDLVSQVGNVAIIPGDTPTLAGGIYVRSGGSDTLCPTTDQYLSSGGVYIPAGNLVAGGGYRLVVDGFYQQAVAASQTAVVLTRLAGTTDSPTAWIAPRAGKITAIAVHSDAARTAGTLTVQIYKNGVAVSSTTAVLDGTNTTFKASTIAFGLLTYAAADKLDIRITTDGTWAPTTANIRASLEVMT